MFGDTPLIIIEDTAALEELVEDLAKKPIIGIDTEADSFHHYQEKVCLIQVSDLEKDYIIDPLKIDDCSSIKRLTGNPDQEVVLHGGDYDVVSMKRDFDVTFNRIFDTMVASQFLGFDRFGLADLIHRYFGHKIDKKYQRHDWSARPLRDEHLQYARGDTHFLLALREVLGHKLRSAGRYRAFEEECYHLAQKEWSAKEDDPAEFMRVKKSSRLKPDGLRVLRALWAYRDDRARRIDRPAFKVLGDRIMIALSTQRPTTRDALHEIIRPSSSLARKHGDDLLAVVAEGLADETPLPDPPRRKRKRRSSRPKDAPSIERLYAPLKDWRNALVEEKGLSPVVVANNALLKEIARAAPETLQDLADVPGIRDWQVRDYGDEILDVVQAILHPPKKKRRRASS